MHYQDFFDSAKDYWIEVKTEIKKFMIIETFYWATENSHANNSETLFDFLENKMELYCGSDYTVFYQDDTYAEIINSKGKHYGVRASGNGDFNNHKVTFEFLV